MPLTSSLKEKEYFASLSEKIYLSPDDSVLEECVRILDLLKEDLNIIQNFDVSDTPIYYSKSEFNIVPEDINFVNDDVEEKKILDSITNSYEFTNIQG